MYEKKKYKKKRKEFQASASKQPNSLNVLSGFNNIITAQIMKCTTQSDKNTESTDEGRKTHDGSSYSDAEQKYQGQGAKDLRWLWSGLIGGGLVILTIVFLAFINPGFRMSTYYVTEDPSLLTELLTAHVSTEDSLNIAEKVLEESKQRKAAIEDLISQKVIVSSKDFASNLTGYYNTLVEVLAGILIILNIIGYFSWRSNANSSLEQKRKELDGVIDNIDNRLEDNLERAFAKNSVVKEKIESIFGNLYDESTHLTDEEWEKLQLLLAKYRKEERLKEINVQDEQNDGEITEK